VKDFKSSYTNKNLSEVSQFREFKNQLDRIFGTDTQTVEQKLKGIFPQSVKKKQK
ncbi:hypothetical protein LCGC14_1582100, partial [marine sediment metagenome]